jgi:polyisoprenoid-binding protein YceI
MDRLMVIHTRPMDRRIDPASPTGDTALNKQLLTTFALLLVAGAAQAQSADWTLDPAHTHVGFTARHLGFAKVRGELRKFSATAQADAKSGKLTALSAVAEAASVDTGVPKRDGDLRTDDFFSAAQFPSLKLVLKSVKWKGAAFTAVVALTLRDVTKDVKFTGELLGVQTVDFGRGRQQHAAYEAHATINRKDFGLKFNGLAEGISIVADEVEIDLEAEFVMSPATPTAATMAPAARNKP